MASEEEAKVAESKTEKKEEAGEDVKMEDSADAEKKDADAEGEAKKEEGVDEEKKEEEKAPEKPKELEEDAPSDDRKKIDQAQAKLSEEDATLNVLRVNGENCLLSSLGEGGMQYLLAGVRATVGVKAGRYMFESRVVETVSHHEPQHSTGPTPPNLIRLGFSLSKSSLFNDTSDSICFDSEGFFCHGKKKTKFGQRIAKGTYTVLLNLDEQSPNAHTVSLFRNGARIGKPQPLPDSFKGKTLFPTVTYRNVMLELNFGPTPRAELPFSCRMIADAAEDDVEIVAPLPATDKCEVVFPVGLPDKGFFDWVDDFISKNPQYVELSDRKIVDWAMKSGIWKPKNQSSSDKPTMQFGLPLMDDGSVRRVIQAFAPTLKRNFVVAELKGNLVPGDRKMHLAHFAKRNFKMSAKVLMGEPTQEFKDKVHDLILTQKKNKVETERKRKIADLQRKKALEEKKKKQEKAKANKDKDEADQDDDDAGEEKEEEPVIEEGPPVELTEEEKQLWFRKSAIPDVSEKMLSKALPNFKIPETEEGFDDVSYEWQPESACAEVLKQYILDYKKTHKAEDLKPGTWFKEQHEAFQKSVSDWRKKLNMWKDPAKRKALLQKKEEDAKKDGEEKEGEEKPAAPMTIDVASLDPFTVEDVADVGSGEPLFTSFAAEDWALLSIMFELHLLLHAFKKDLNDPERPSFPEAHLGFYYERYFKKQFSPASFGFKETNDFLQILKGVVTVDGANNFLGAELSEDTPAANFVKLAEDHRRDRQRRVDAGDESALLKFSKQVAQQSQKASQKKGESREGGGGKGGSKGAGKKQQSWGGRDSQQAPQRQQTSSGDGRPWGKGQKGKGADEKRQQWPSSRGSVQGPSRIPAWNGSGAGGGAPKRWSPPPQQPQWKRPRSEYGAGKGGGGGGGGSYFRR